MKDTIARRRLLGAEVYDQSEQGTQISVRSVARMRPPLTVYGHSTQDGTPSPDNPVPIVSAGSVMTTGAQLFDASKLQTQSAGGATVTNNGDGSFTVSGSGNLSSVFNYYYDYSHEETITLLQSGKTIKVTQTSTTIPTIVMQLRQGGTTQQTVSTSGYTITEEDIQNPDFHIRLLMYGGSGTEIVPGTYKPMVYQDGDGTWEPYTGGQPAANPYEGEINVTISDGGTQSQFLTVSAPGGLPGIPVDASKLPEGMEPTYVDDSGQAWVCDEVDFERGVYVRRVWKHTFDGSETWRIYSTFNGFYSRSNTLPESMNSREGFANSLYVFIENMPDKPSIRFGANNNIVYAMLIDQYDSSLEDSGLSSWKAHLAAHPLEVMTYLETPTETPLSAEEITAYKALHTYSPTTTVSNDAGAWMKLGYKTKKSLQLV